MLRIPVPSLDLLGQPEQEVGGVDEVFYALNEGLSAYKSRHYGRDVYVVLTSSGWFGVLAVQQRTVVLCLQVS